MKILLIHGWNPDNYYNQTNNIAWSNRIKLINELKKDNEVFYPDLPGFGLTIPDKVEYTLDDYASWINDYLINNKLKVDLIIGYSFGGAVAIRYKTKFNNNIKLVLISPAIIRDNNKSKKFIKTPKFLNKIRSILRDFYVIHILKIKEMKLGDSFLRKTYQNIVRVNLIDELQNNNYKDIKIIYGKNDNMVSPYKVFRLVNDNFRDRIFMIEGDHDIGSTNIKEIIKIIKEK